MLSLLPLRSLPDPVSRLISNKIRSFGSRREAAAESGEPRGRVSLPERLLRLGPKVLGPGEILALVLGGGGPAPAPVTAQEVLARHGTLAALSGADPVLLCRERGMGPVRAARLLAAFELGARTRIAGERSRIAVHAPGDVLPLLTEEFRGCDREHFLALSLDTRHRVTTVETVSVGCLNASLVHPREVFRSAVRRGAAALLVAHNHPSGCATPSRDDLALTARLDGCGRLLGIELLDHIIVGDGEFTSVREYGWPGEG